MKKRIVSVLLSLVTCFGFLGACNEEETSTTEKAYVAQKFTYTDGVHVLTAPEIDPYLVRNGNTEYKLVLPETQGKYIAAAESDFRTFFQEATGINIKTVTESGEGLTHNASDKYISIGQTKLLESADLDIDYDSLGIEGVRIVTKDNNIYLVGGADEGSLYAVYDFMQIVFDFEIYYHDCWVINKATDVKLRQFDVTDIPDLPLRRNGWGNVADNVNNIGFRFRSPYSFSDCLIPAGDEEHGATPQSIHNSDNVLPSSYWKVEHPRWFSDAGGNLPQLCYTAHGDKREYNAMVEQIVKVFVSNLRDYPIADFPRHNYISLTMEDNWATCSCTACVNARYLYGNDTGAVIVLCNNVMERLQEEMQKPENIEYYRKDLKLVFFAYHNFVDAPATYSEKKGEYVPNHPDLQMREDVGVYFAQSTDMQYLVNIYDEQNQEAREICLKWASLTDNVYLWTYQINFLSYLTMHDSFNFYTSEAYQFYASLGADAFSNQGAKQLKDLSNFNGLKAFLDYKLAWDSTLDEEKLTDEWFENMYGVTAPIMRELFNAERKHNLLIMNNSGNLSNFKLSVNMYKPTYWPLSTLRSWIDSCEKALAMAEDMYAKYEPQTYQMIKEHIDMEWVPSAYLILSLYESSYIPTEEYNGYLDYFDEVFLHLGSMTVNEPGATLASVINGLR